MTEIPADVMEQAEDIVNSGPSTDPVMAAARAIMAERERHTPPPSTHVVGSEPDEKLWCES